VAGYAEVIIQFNQPRNFSTIFQLFNKSATGTIPVTARTVARGLMITNSGAGIICLDPTAPSSLGVTGDGSIIVKSGPIIVDSNNAKAVTLTGNGGVTTAELDITGRNPGYNTTGNGQITTAPTSNNINTGQLRTPDPLATLPAPDPTTMPVQSTSSLHITESTPVVLQPGVYKGGIQITSGGSVTLMPGIYYLEGGGFAAAGTGSLTGAGVMLYNAPVGTDDTISLSGNGTMNLTPPTSGTYQGMAIFQARSPANVPISLTGNGGAILLGTVYAPTSPVTVTANASATIGSQFICDTLTATGGANVTVDWAGFRMTPTRDLRVVE
jgi:hypothetical protein